MLGLSRKGPYLKRKRLGIELGPATPFGTVVLESSSRSANTFQNRSV